MKTIEELSKLSDEELRVMCAELDGFVNILHRGDDAFQFAAPVGCKQPVGRRLPCGKHERLPNYPADLNAMHEAERTIPVGKWTSYENNLMKLSKAELISAEVPPVDAARICTISATARQRCIAFIAVKQPHKKEAV